LDWHIEPGNADQEGLQAAAFEVGKSFPTVAVPSDPADPPPLKRTCMEEEPEEECLYRQKFPQPAGTSFGRGETQFDKLRQLQHNGKTGQIGPFADVEEWELAKWLMSSGTSQTAIDEFLKLSIVSIALLFQHFSTNYIDISLIGS